MLCFKILGDFNCVLQWPVADNADGGTKLWRTFRSYTKEKEVRGYKNAKEPYCVSQEVENSNVFF
jgi:hypothetical protein